MVEVFVAISISLIVMSTVSVMLRESSSLINQTDNRIELMEQFSEMKSTIKKEFRNSNNIKFYSNGKKASLTNEFLPVDNIVFSQVQNVKIGVPIIKEKNMYVSGKNKLFIYYNGGAYELGNYVTKIEAKKDSEGSFSIKLKLNKSNNVFSDIISIRLRN